MTIPNLSPTRKHRFNAALALANLTKKRFRDEHYAVSRTHLDAVLDGREGGPDLNAAIDALIAKWLPDSPEGIAARAATEESDEPTETTTTVVANFALIGAVMRVEPLRRSVQ